MAYAPQIDLSILRANLSACNAQADGAFSLLRPSEASGNRNVVSISERATGASFAYFWA